MITWTHVYGHTGHHDNELADRAADAGAKLKVGSDSRRWSAPPPPIPELEEPDQGTMDMCRKCGEMFPVNKLKWHVRRCKSILNIIPEGKDKCRKCGYLGQQGNRTQHERNCKGSALANRTCSKCQAVFPEVEDGGISRRMRVHESLCHGTLPARLAAAIGAPKAKAKATPKRNAKAMAKPKTRPLRRISLKRPAAA